MRLPSALRSLIVARFSADRKAEEAERLAAASRNAPLPEPFRAILPEPGRWTCPDDVAAHARACLDACGLTSWEFGWDRAVKRLGCCRVARRRVTLSRYFVEAHLDAEPLRIRDTILHEIAHALAWEQARHAGHGPLWKAWCRALGATPRATVAECRDFDPRPPRYRLQHADTGEVFREYARRPRFRRGLKNMYMRGRPDTLGKLRLVEIKPPAGGE